MKPQVLATKRNRQQMLNAVCEATRNALERWRQGAATDNDARWISALMDDQLLRSELPGDTAVSQCLQDYQKLEQAIPITRRTPGVPV